MKKFILAFFSVSLLSASFSSKADSSKADDVDAWTKYCYYDDKAYSLGAEMLQEGDIMKCVKSKSNNAKSKLIWISKEKIENALK